jgi:hypothetical protein
MAGALTGGLMRLQHLALVGFAITPALVLGCGQPAEQPQEQAQAPAQEEAKEEPAASARGKVGDACEQDGDCEGGLCIDLRQFDDGCTGKVCTQTCESDSDCPEVAGGADCDPFGEGDDAKNVCLYGAWEEQYCN